MLEQMEPFLRDPQTLISLYAETARRASALIHQYIQQQAQNSSNIPGFELWASRSFMDLMGSLLANPYRFTDTQFGLIRDYYTLWQHSMLRFIGITPDEKNKSGTPRSWEELFLFDFVKQSYLVTVRYLYDVIHRIDHLDSETREQIEHHTRRYIQSLSPAGFTVINPQIYRETLLSRGQNLLYGLNNILHNFADRQKELLQDITEKTFLLPGTNVATTPGKVVAQNALMQLIQYAPAGAEVYRKPLLLVPPWNSKYYILDMQPDESFIRWCVAQGHTVFVISWATDSSRISARTLEDYVHDGIIAALDAIEQQTGETQTNVAGYCLGGSLLAIALAYLNTRGQQRMASAAFFATDLSHRAPSPSHTGAHLDMTLIFNALRLNDLIWSFVTSNFLLGKKPFPFALLQWNTDTVQTSDAMLNSFLQPFLVDAPEQPVPLTINGIHADLSAIRTPCYFFAAIEDHMTPWQNIHDRAHTLKTHTPDTRFVLGGSGHISGMLAAPQSEHNYYYTQTAPDTANAADWLAQAQRHDGSWWQDWQDWLNTLDNTRTAAARRPKQHTTLPALQDAPGSYAL